METVVIIAFALLFIKHWYVDFVNQDMEEVNHKGIYLHWKGMKHSLKQGLATGVIFFILGATSPVFLGMLDFVIHYHTDWVKMNYGNRDIQNPQFWNHLGLDQLAHYMTYLLLVWLAVVM